MVSDLYERNTSHNCKTNKCREPPTNISDVKWLRIGNTIISFTRKEIFAGGGERDSKYEMHQTRRP